MAGSATAVRKIGGKEGWPHVVVANPDEQICAHPGFDLCGEFRHEQCLVSLAAPDCEVVRDVQHGDRVLERYSVRNSVSRDDLLGKIFRQIKRPCSKHSNTPCSVRNSAP